MFIAETSLESVQMDAVWSHQRNCKSCTFMKVFLQYTNYNGIDEMQKVLFL